jgi:hypothetical protein
MKAQSFFGGTKTKETGVQNRNIGNKSATPGVNNVMNNAQTLASKRGFGVPSLATRSASHRPSITGKVDNRRGKGNGC